MDDGRAAEVTNLQSNGYRLTSSTRTSQACRLRNQMN
jgi:hypothetical protein